MLLLYNGNADTDFISIVYLEFLCLIGLTKKHTAGLSAAEWEKIPCRRWQKQISNKICHYNQKKFHDVEVKFEQAQ